MNLDLIVKMKFGSHLYGTATENSDTDYKGVYLPEWRQILLQRVPKSQSFKTKNSHEEGVKNDSSDIDEEIYSLHYFLELACQGQTVAIDMLHAPDNMLVHSSRIWRELRGYRSKFYTKNLSSLVGYARRQAAKYGIKGSRLANAKAVLEFLKSVSPDIRLGEVWDQLPVGEHISKFETESPRMYQVCGKLLQDTAKVKMYIDPLQAYVKEYGHRAELAEKNEGVDWKAISHAFRAAFQTKHILVDGGFDYPLYEAPFLLKVKKGELPYKEVAEQLEDLIDECMILSEKSSLPAKVDREWWDDWLVDVLG